MNESMQSRDDGGCLDSGMLVAQRDGELTANEAAMAASHLATCAGCAAEERAVTGSGREVYELLASLDPQEQVLPDPVAALSRLQMGLAGERRDAEDHEALTPIPLERARRPSWYRRRNWIATAAAALLVAVLVGAGPAGALANQFLALFRVQQFQAVTLDPQTLSAIPLPDIQNFGSLQVSSNAGVAQQDLSEAQAARLVNFPIQLPSSLPSGVGGSPQFSVVHGGQATFTFSAASVRAYLARSGHGTIAIPANLNGATFTINAASGLLVNYTVSCQQSRPVPVGKLRLAVEGSHTGAAPAGAKAKAAWAACGGSPFIVMEIPSPVIRATGSASLDDLRNFLLSLPGLPPQLVAQLRQINLSTGTVPVPIPPQVSAQQVTIQGAPGLLLADNTPIGGAVLWQTHGMIYALGGAVGNATQLLDTANSLR
jgi:hypothetical protein